MNRMALPKESEGSALVAVLLLITVLSVMVGTSVSLVQNRDATLYHSGYWREALVAAEAGMHQGIARIERGLIQNALLTGTQNFTISLPRSGEGPSNAVANYSITRVDQQNRPYYRIRSTGTVGLPSTRERLSGDGRDVSLRKLNLSGNNPTAVRVIEAWIKPRLNTDAAVSTDKNLTLKPHLIVVDGFNSADPLRSSSGLPSPVLGAYNVAPYNINIANIATNSQFADAGNATVYGDALTNGGAVGGADNIKGLIRDDYNQPLAPVYTPSWVSTTTPGVAVPKPSGSGTMTVTRINSAATITGGTLSSPARYVVDSIALAGNSDILTFDYGLSSGTADSTKKYVELYVRGDFSTKGGGTSSTTESGSVVVKNGVQVTVYVAGNLTLAGNGLANNNNLASSMSIYGVTPPEGTTQSWTVSGNSAIFATVYAPGADIKLAGGGSDGTFVGSIAAKSATLSGNVKLRYDEALSGQGIITGFTIASWIEDARNR